MRIFGLIMHLYPSILKYTIIVSSVIFCSSVANSQMSKPLSNSHRQLALEVEAASEKSVGTHSTQNLQVPPNLAETKAGLKNKSVVISAIPTGSPSTTKRLHSISPSREQIPNRAIVTRYDYATCQTIRTIVDLDNRKVLGKRVKLNYPTPFSTDEKKTAIEILRSGVLEINDLAEKHSDIKFAVFPIIVRNTSDKRYCHRLAQVWALRPIPSKKYLIDLSEEEIILE